MTDDNELDRSLRELQRLDDPAVQAELATDEELLSLYVDGGQATALEQLIVRYAPMVASVCRLTVADPLTAEDAFQATFLILIKSAKKIRRRESVAAWLHGVAYRTASRMRKMSHGNSSNEGSEVVIAQGQDGDDPIVQLARKMELETLNRELEQLPDSLRAPLVEHYLLGQSAPAIAKRMELSVAAVEGRLKRGRRRLRTQLARRGISLSVLVAGSSLFQRHLHAAEATAWTESFIGDYLPAASTHGSAAGIESTNPNISSLVSGELNMVSTGALKFSVAAGVLLAAGTLAVATAQSGGGGQPIPFYMPAGQTDEPAVAQFGGSPTPAATGAAAASSTPAQAASNSGMRMGMTAGVTANNNSGMEEQQKKLAWVQPENTDIPAWLSGGNASMKAMEANREILAQEIEVDYPGTPLIQVVQDIQDRLESAFYLNADELENMGVAPDQPIVLQSPQPITVREFLRRALQPLDLTYRVTESGIEITSQDDAENHTNIRFYDLSFVLPNSANADALMNAIQQSISPDSWLAAGGQSTLTLVGSMMIVTSPDSVHQQIEVLLLNIAQMNPKNVETAVPQQNTPYGMGGGMGGMGGMGGGMGGMGGGTGGMGGGGGYGGGGQGQGGMF